MNKLEEKILEEHKVIKLVFQNKEHLLILLRKMFLGFELSNEEKIAAQEILNNKELMQIIERRLNPKVTGDEHVYNVNDLWLQLSLREKTKEDAILLMHIVRSVEQFIEKAVAHLKGSDDFYHIDDLRYNEERDDFSNLVAVSARNIVLSSVESTIHAFQTIAEGTAKDKSEADKKKDSAK